MTVRRSSARSPGVPWYIQTGIWSSLAWVASAATKKNVQKAQLSGTHFTRYAAR
jgi:hypothetical protein